MEQSLTAFTKLTESNGRNGEGWHGVGWALAHLNRESEALVPLQCAIQLKRQNASAHRELGDCYFKLRRFEEALLSYQQYISLKVDDPKPEKDKSLQWRNCVSFVSFWARHQAAGEGPEIGPKFQKFTASWALSISS